MVARGEVLCLALGASGGELEHIVQPDARDGRGMRPCIPGKLVFDRRAGDSAPALTPRERDVVRLVADGRTNDEVGATLGVTAKTVEAHLGRIFERTGVQSRTELATKAIREGWLELPARS
jgi:DNA-binding CsgD family transcriptional regulator